MFKATSLNPYHLSVGIVLIDSEEKIVCHYWKEKNDYKYFYSLIHETVEEDESLEEAISRGLDEELGAVYENLIYIGSRVSSDVWKFDHKPVEVEKTVVYFKANLVSYNLDQKSEDWESDSEVLHVEKQTLIQKFEKQYAKFHLERFNEAEILKRI